MPDKILDTDPSDFEITLQDLDFASKKAKLVNKVTALVRSLDGRAYDDKVKIHAEIALLEEQIRQMEQARMDAILH